MQHLLPHKNFIGTGSYKDKLHILFHEALTKPYARNKKDGAVRWKELVESSADRTNKAKEIARSLLHDAKLHQLAMSAVFVLEDVHEVLVRRDREERERADLRRRD